MGKNIMYKCCYANCDEYFKTQIEYLKHVVSKHVPPTPSKENVWEDDGNWVHDPDMGDQ